LFGGGLLVAFGEDRCAVAVSTVTKLSAYVCRINGAEKQIKQSACADYFGIKGDLHGFVVAGATCGDLFVCRVFRRAACISRYSDATLSGVISAPPFPVIREKYAANYSVFLNGICLQDNT
jgi:hypothetical protein